MLVWKTSHPTRNPFGLNQSQFQFTPTFTGNYPHVNYLRLRPPETSLGRSADNPCPAIGIVGQPISRTTTMGSEPPGLTVEADRSSNIERSHESTNQSVPREMSSRSAR